MTFIEVAILVNSTGVLGLGVGALKWAFKLDKRVTVLETKERLQHPMPS